MSKKGYNSGARNKDAYSTQKDGKVHPIYNIWYNMMERCYNPKCDSHFKYGAIGVSVCIEWHDYQIFAKWAEIHYLPGHDLDKDIKGNGMLYSPDTCSFVTRQANNEKAVSRTYTLKSPAGEVVEIYNLEEYCRNTNLHAQHMRAVFNGKRKSHKGWTKN